ncbi:MAG: Rho termination factor N-terminal domain-containing protein [Planctomycetota bacterium]
MPATKAKAKQKNMTVSDIRNKAKRLGINSGKMKKPELIHSIQTAEGYTPCFGRSNGECVQADCCFMRDCLKARL